MKTFFLLAIVAVSMPLAAQIAPTPARDQAALLKAADQKLAANKKLVYDFWREVLEARHLDLAEKYMREDYIQHNPNAATGRKGFTDYFSKQGGPQPIAATIKKPLISIIAEGDLVMLSFVQENPDPKDSAKKYSTTWFDVFRIDNGKIAEHWDSSSKN
jgi:predicted SnoaL-like aldol condensation-catalyzing enzyme